MTAIAQEFDAKLQSVDAEKARRLERLVREAIVRAEATPEGDDFAQSVHEEEELRARFSQAGRQFSARDRLSRDELHDRDALR